MNQNSAVTPPQRGDVTPFMGYLVELERSEAGIFVNIPINVLNNAGLSNGMNKVEVWRELDGTISFRIATRCEICKRGARLYELDMGFAKKHICIECYTSLTGNYPSQQPPTNENTMQSM
ncbi:hypothetical protein CN423_21615 [Bacillus cereus]|uniref:hypothetical protein n=1 Tax=Bacillus cereus group TaxID=86661 RepID=UPI000BEE606F|nr:MULTISPECIES: hypothetical protein [Bacillus cereus group]MEB9947024.1 hypothetical protein [Bacillus cereus]PEC99487.1 hypothetical protein CON14_28910 [Bacillus cereus]PED90593.1 hypothetical protein CON43_03725 [Bacillus cereus]PET99900.1 hypothetical protein CN534_10910 [Bacillus cereus]PEV61563.1 hypothetical protein CN423_21615 [Bacillus cereus]